MCADFDDVAKQVAKDCKMEERAGKNWMKDSTEDLCKNIFGDSDGGHSECTILAQEKLLGYSLKCMLNSERREEMKDGALMYKNKDDTFATGLVNLFFFECGAASTGNVWLHPSGYVKPWKPEQNVAAHNLGAVDDGADGQSDDDEDLSKDADDELQAGLDDAYAWDSSGADQKTKRDPMDDEQFKIRYELGELTEDELVDLNDADLEEYLVSDKYDANARDKDDAKSEL